jgi:YesN/AraC family two-component response regulator
MRKILVIEDEAQGQNSFLEYLKAEGFDTIGAENGGVSLQRVQEQLSDLVLCNVRMLELDGYVVLATLYQNPAETATSAASQSIFPSNPQLSKVFHFIEANYQQPIGLCEVAKAVGYSPAYLTDLVRRQTGISVKRWIVKRRMAAARSLLLKTNQSVEQIAEAVGYSHMGCFFRQFRRSFGMTPQSWRNAHRIQSSTKKN